MIYLLIILAMALIASVTYNVILINKCYDMSVTNVELAHILSDIKKISAIIGKNHGWALNKDLNELMILCHQFESITTEINTEEKETDTSGPETGEDEEELFR